MTTLKKEITRPSGKTSFIRYNVVAIMATLADFLVLILLTEFGRMWYLLSTGIGALVGATIAFTLGRNWAFVSKDEKSSRQAIRYGMVAIGSLVLNTFGVYLFTDTLGLQYVISKSFTAVIVALGYNYPLSRYYTFKQL